MTYKQTKEHKNFLFLLSPKYTYAFPQRVYVLMLWTAFF
jgi:hypothetical protein